MKNPGQDFKVFFKRYQRELFLAGFLLTLALFHFLYSDNYRMDSTIKLATLGDEFNDLELGRFGIVYLNRLFGLNNYTPYFMAYVTMLAMLASGVLMSFSLWRAMDGRCGREVCLMPLLVYLTPNWIEQLYFSYQSFLIILGVIALLAAALIPAYTRARLWMAVEALLALLAFSIYQAFVPLYITLCIGFVLTQCVFREAMDGLEVWRRFIRHAVVFALALAGYFAVNWLFTRSMEGTDYLSSQVRWGTMPIQGVVMSQLRAIGSILIAQGRLDTLLYPVSLLCSAVLLAVRCPQWRRDRRLVAALGWFLLQLSAFAMIVITGSRLQLRTELSVTFAAGFNFIIALALARQCASALPRRALALGTAAAMLVCLYGSTDLCLRLVYTDDVQSAADEALASRLVERLKPLLPQGNNRTVVFVGEPEMYLNDGCVVGEAIGRSLFNHFIGLEDSNLFIANVMAAKGVKYRTMTSEEGRQAEAMAADMPCFPEEGSVAALGDVIAVKFSQDYYYEAELLKPGCEPSEETVEYGEGLQYNVEHIEIEDDAMIIEGYNIRRGVDARTMKNTLYLLNRVNGALYRINTACNQQVMLTNQFWQDGVNYDQGGFKACCPVDILRRNPRDTFELLVKYDLPGETGFVGTGILINLRSIGRGRSDIAEDGLVGRVG